VKFQALPWYTKVLTYAVIYGVLVALLEPYKPPNTPLKNGLISAAVFLLLVGPVMRWSSKRRTRKAASAEAGKPTAVAA
jgi:hypothetical protein